MSKITICGRCGSVELVGDKLVKFSIAEDHWNYKDKVKETIWYNCVSFNPRVIKLSDHILKGKILVFGDHFMEEYEGKKYPRYTIQDLEIVEWPKDKVTEEAPDGGQMPF